MQNIDLICIGKMNAKYFAEGVAEYQKRLAAFAAFRIIELPEEKIEEKNASDAVVKKHWRRKEKPSSPMCARVLPSLPCALRAGRSPPMSWRSSWPTAQTAGQGMWRLSSAPPTACPMR